jgi:hypothetical protein
MCQYGQTTNANRWAALAQQHQGEGMFVVIRVLKIVEGVLKNIGVVKVENGADYSILDGCSADIVDGFPSLDAADMHIRYPLSYPDGQSAQEVVDAPFDRAGWEVFYNPTSGTSDPDNAEVVLK